MRRRSWGAPVCGAGLERPRVGEQDRQVAGEPVGHPDDGLRRGASHVRHSASIRSIASAWSHQLGEPARVPAGEDRGEQVLDKLPDPTRSRGSRSSSGVRSRRSLSRRGRREQPRRRVD